MTLLKQLRYNIATSVSCRRDPTHRQQQNHYSHLNTINTRHMQRWRQHVTKLRQTVPTRQPFLGVNPHINSVGLIRPGKTKAPPVKKSLDRGLKYPILPAVADAFDCIFTVIYRANILILYITSTAYVW